MKPDYYLIPRIVQEARETRPADWLVYATVYWLEQAGGGECFASNAFIARTLGMGERTVGLALKHLEDGGFIERSFEDKLKRHRLRIHCLVTYQRTPSLFKVRTDVPSGDSTNVPSRDSTNVPHSIKKREINTAAPKTATAPVKLFSSEETKKKWYDGEDPVFQLLAWFFDKKGLWSRFDSRAKVEAAVRRHIRSARRIDKAEWSQRECQKALAKMLEANPKMREEWTLDTLEKYLTK
jgi:DNA-binding transcriptional ArsR family regulator